MKNVFALFCIGVIMYSCSSTKNTANLAINLPIQTTIDLTNVTNDKVPVTINPGRFTTDKIIYRLPKVIPGDYSVSDFGSFVENFVAYDYSGNEMMANKISNNSWSIENATKLDKIVYLVNDTFDMERGSSRPFSPSGTNIHPNNYVLNLHGFIGYFDSLKNNSYKLNVNAPSDFVRSSALKEVETVANTDGKSITSSYYAPRYFDITDNPMMYGKFGVEEFKVGDITVVLSVYSPNKLHSAASLKESMYKMMEAQKMYLGDINSTQRYDIYVYLSDGIEDTASEFGALEHHTSTVVVMPERMQEKALAKSMIDIVAHEFFHIVTPLTVHSKNVHYFDYNFPTYSKHLWMYEGVTEYFAHHFQVYEGLITESEFYRNMVKKILFSSRYNDSMSFIKMSENVTEQPYAANFNNVYEKGALIGMCLDILMREESNGNRSMLSLMKELSLKYGKNIPFNDDNIIQEITTMTYPSIGSFLKTHVEGETPINYQEFFDKVGLKKLGWMLKPIENPTQAQLNLRNAWLKG